MIGQSITAELSVGSRLPFNWRTLSCAYLNLITLLLQTLGPVDNFKCFSQLNMNKIHAILKYIRGQSLLLTPDLRGSTLKPWLENSVSNMLGLFII